MNRSALFVSTLNEIEGVTSLWEKLPLEAFSEVYALDGGSTDGTVEFFNQKGIPVLPGVKKGEIFNAGAAATECEELVFFAPDGNENPADILPLLERLREGFDMVIASRFMKQSRNEEDDQLFKWRKWANQSFTLIVRMIWGGALTDTINGFRSVRRSAILEMNLDPTGFDIEFQMSIRGLKLGHAICEIPTIEFNRLGGESTAYSFPTGILMLKRVLKELRNGKSFARATPIDQQQKVAVNQ